MMKYRPTPTLIALGLAACSLASCGSAKTAMNKVSTPVQGLTKMNANDWKTFKLRGLRGNTPPVVQVRTKDLIKMQTGEEKYLAWHRSNQLSHTSPDGVFFMPEDFDPASLSEGEISGTYGILPALNSNDKSNEQPGTPVGDLPAID